jgi:hypothetical protein
MSIKNESALHKYFCPATDLHDYFFRATNLHGLGGPHATYVEPCEFRTRVLHNGLYSELYSPGTLLNLCLILQLHISPQRGARVVT